jgi:hypothetical protein
MPETWRTDYTTPGWTRPYATNPCADVLMCSAWDHVFRSGVDLKCVCGRTMRALR